MKSLTKKRNQGVIENKNNSHELYDFFVSVLEVEPETAFWLAGHVVEVENV